MPVTLADMADVVDSAENERQAAWMNDTEAVIVNIQRQPGANIIAVVDRVNALLPQLKTTLPSAVNVDTLTDRTSTIRASVKDVQFELMLTVALVVMVIFLFLRTIAATIIPSVAVPLSLVGTFGAMYLLGYSLNNLTLMALTISTGFVVDDAIVMIENIIRYIEEGEKPLAAALKGSAQIGFTIVSLSVSLIAALIPLLFMGDIVGRLFREFAVTLSVTIVVSAIVSLTLTPMMCALLLKHKTEAQQGWFYRKSEQAFEWVIGIYGKDAAGGAAAPVLHAAGGCGDAGVDGRAVHLHSERVFPGAGYGGDSRRLRGGRSRFRSMRCRSGRRRLADVILKDPAVESLSSFIGVDGTNTTVNSGRIQITLKPLEERKISASDVIRRLQRPLEKVEGITLFMQPVQDLTVEDRVSRTQFQYTLEDADPQELGQWVPQFIAKLKQIPELTDVASDEQTAALQAQLVINRDMASRLAITPQMIDDALYDAFGQRQVTTMFTQLNQYHVVLEALPEFQQHPEDLDHIYVKTATSGNVPLSAFTTLVKNRRRRWRSTTRGSFRW